MSIAPLDFSQTYKTEIGTDIYACGQFIGDGTYSVVWKGHHIESLEEIALKIPKSDDSTEKILRESRILRFLNEQDVEKRRTKKCSGYGTVSLFVKKNSSFRSRKKNFAKGSFKFTFWQIRRWKFFPFSENTQPLEMILLIFGKAVFGLLKGFIKKRKNTLLSEEINHFKFF